MADHPWPDAYFGWIYDCYALASAGYTIENDRLSMTEWKDLSTMKALLESGREDKRLSNLSTELIGFLMTIGKGRR